MHYNAFMNLRRFLILVGILGVLVLVFSTFGNPVTIIQVFQKVRWYVVPLVILMQIISYYYNARYYQEFFSIFGHNVNFRRLYEASLAINFANQAIPSGGVAGTTYLAEAVKGEGVPPSQTTLAQLNRYIFTFVSFFIVLAFGFLMLLFGNDLDKVSVRFMILLMVIVLTAGLVLLAIFSERSRLERILYPIIRLFNRLSRSMLKRRDKPLIAETQVDTFLTEFYHGLHEVIEHKGRWPALLWWSLGGNLAEVATLYAVFVGFGAWVNPGIVISAYTLGIAASVAGILVNGIGVLEAGLIGTFAALGVPFALAFAVTIVYRVLSFILFLPPGLYFYRRHLKEAEGL
jgi:uncharacterized protein (TIRG00374 family)